MQTEKILDLMQIKIETHENLRVLHCNVTANISCRLPEFYDNSYIQRKKEEAAKQIKLLMHKELIEFSEPLFEKLLFCAASGKPLDHSDYDQIIKLREMIF